MLQIAGRGPVSENWSELRLFFTVNRGSTVYVYGRSPACLRAAIDDPRSGYVTEDHHRIEWPVTHHDDSGWWWASTVRLEGDRTGDGTADLFIEYTNYTDPSTPYGWMIAGVVGANYPYLDGDNLFFG